MTIQCQQCGKKFQPLRVYAKFCGVACRMRAYRRRLKRRSAATPLPSAAVTDVTAPSGQYGVTDRRKGRGR